MNSLIFLLLPLVLILNGLWYWGKSILRDNGYDVGSWIHFPDIANIFQLAKRTQDKVLKTKCYTLGLSLVVGLVLLPVAFFAAIPTIDDRRCDQRDRFLGKEWHGRLTKSYVDSQNHNSWTIELKSGNRTFINSDFNWSQRDDFEFLQPGDSLSKRRGDIYVTVIRNDQVKEIIFDFGCAE